MAILPSKFIAETIDVRWDFLGEMPFGETVSSAVITVTVISGIDGNPNGLLSGSNVITGTVVKRKITAGQLGVIYNLSCLATSNTGRTYEVSHKLAVGPNTGITVPFEPLTLTGILPTAFVGVPYSETLQIAGGIPPYVSADIISGAMPPWMLVSIVGDLMLFSGTPTVIASYSFVPQVTDWGGYTAIDPQAAIDFQVTDPPLVFNQAFALRENSTLGFLQILYSPDGLDWSGAWQNTAPNAFAYRLSLNDRAMFYSAANNPRYSDDLGVTWQISTGATVSGSGNFGGFSLATGTILIPAGSGSGGMVRSTDNGASFATVPGSPGGASPTYKGTSWFLYNGGFFRSDDDGVNWTAQLGGFTDLSNSPGFAVETDNIQVVVVSSQVGTSAPRIVETTNGAAFTYPAMPVGLSPVGCFMKVAYGRNIFVAVTNTNEIVYRRTDGIWRKSAATVGSTQPEDLIFNGAVFILMQGDSLVTSTGTIKTSEDGNVWTTRRSEAFAGISQRWRFLFCPR